MFGSNVVNSGLSLGKVLNGISKTLSIANQVIPLYQQAKPMINNAKTILNVLKGIKATNNPAKNNNITTKKETENKSIIENTNTPIFFQ